jgi:hypothetical protein
MSAAQQILLLLEQTSRGGVTDDEFTERLILRNRSAQVLQASLPSEHAGTNKMMQLMDAMTEWDAVTSDWMDDDAHWSLDDLLFDEASPGQKALSLIATTRGRMLLQVEANAREALETHWRREWECLESSCAMQQLRQAEPRYDFASGCVQVHHGRPGTGRVWSVPSEGSLHSVASKRGVAWTPQHFDRSRSSSGRPSRGDPPPWW